MAHITMMAPFGLQPQLKNFDYWVIHQQQQIYMQQQQLYKFTELFSQVRSDWETRESELRLKEERIKEFLPLLEAGLRHISAQLPAACERGREQPTTDDERQNDENSDQNEQDTSGSREDPSITRRINPRPTMAANKKERRENIDEEDVAAVAGIPFHGNYFHLLEDKDDTASSEEEEDHAESTALTNPHQNHPCRKDNQTRKSPKHTWKGDAASQQHDMLMDFAQHIEEDTQMPSLRKEPERRRNTFAAHQIHCANSGKTVKELVREFEKHSTSNEKGGSEASPTPSLAARLTSCDDDDINAKIAKIAEINIDYPERVQRHHANTMQKNWDGADEAMSEKRLLLSGAEDPALLEYLLPPCPGRGPPAHAKLAPGVLVGHRPLQTEHQPRGAASRSSLFSE